MNNIPSNYRPLNPWEYFLYSILFSIPVIGFILLIKFEEKSLYIQDLRISKLYQNKGYGTKIIKELIINSKMLSITKLTVTCKSDNHEGFKFFTKFDFVKDIEEDSDEFNYHLYL